MIIEKKILLINKYFYLAIFLSFIVLQSCSRQDKTTLIITKSASLGVPQNGGIMIWGYHSDSGESLAISINNTDSSKEVALKVGEWKFFSIGWTGDSYMEGENRCAVESVNLRGARHNLSLLLNKSNCSNEAFSSSENIVTDNQFKKLRILDCVSSGELEAISTAEDSRCSDLNSAAGSFRVIFHEVYESQASELGLKSACQTFTKSVANTSLLVPTGNSAINKMYTSIEVYSDENCVDNIQLFTYSNGIGKPQSYNVDSSKFFISSNDNSLTTDLFILYSNAEPEEEVAVEAAAEIEVYINNHSLLFNTLFADYPSVLFYSPLIIGSEISSPGVSGINDISISFWTKLNSSDLEGTIIEQSDNSILTAADDDGFLDISFEIFISGSSLCFVFNESSENHCVDIDDNNLLDDEWHHLVFIRKYIDGNTEMYIYIDNVESFSVSEGQLPSDVNLLPVIVGPEFRGMIDELAIWNKALESNQVDAVYNSGVTFDLSVDNEAYLSSGNLTGFWNFNQTVDHFSKNGGVVSYDDINGNLDYSASSTLLIDDMTAYAPQRKDDIPNNSKYINISSMYFETDSGTDDTNFTLLDTSSQLYSFDTGKGSGVTLSAWIKTSSEDNCQTIMAQAEYDSSGSDPHYYYILAVRNGKVTWELYADDAPAFTAKVDYENEGLLVSNIAVNDGDWHHIVVIRPSTMFLGAYWNTIYIDGIARAAEPEISDVDVVLNKNLYVSIGGHSGHYYATSEYLDTCLFQGYIDEVSIWDKELSSDEITSLYNNGHPIDIKNNKGDYLSSQNIKAYWPFDDKNEPLLEYNTYYGDIDFNGKPDEDVYTIIPSLAPINYPLTPPYAETTIAN